MFRLYKTININKEKSDFSMPFSLRLIKECASYSLEWRNIHIIDLLSIVYAFRIDNAKKYIKQKQQQSMNKKGIASISKASADDFDSL